MIRRPPRSTLFPYTTLLPIFRDRPTGEKGQYCRRAAVRGKGAGPEYRVGDLRDRGRAVRNAWGRRAGEGEAELRPLGRGVEVRCLSRDGRKPRPRAYRIAQRPGAP